MLPPQISFNPFPWLGTIGDLFGVEILSMPMLPSGASSGAWKLERQNLAPSNQSWAPPWSGRACQSCPCICGQSGSSEVSSLPLAALQVFATFCQFAKEQVLLPVFGKLLAKLIYPRDRKASALWMVLATWRHSDHEPYIQHLVSRPGLFQTQIMCNMGQHMGAQRSNWWKESSRNPWRTFSFDWSCSSGSICGVTRFFPRIWL